jgi:hypothetical protein
MEIDSDSGSESSYAVVGMAMEEVNNDSDSEEDAEQERKRQRVGTPGRSQSDGEVTFEPVFEEEKAQVVKAIVQSTDSNLNDMGEHEIAAIGGVQNRPSVPGFPHIHSPPTPPQPIEPPQEGLPVQDQSRIPLFDREPIDPVARVLSAEEQRQFGMISRNIHQWQRNFLRKYGTQRLSPEESFIVRKPVTNLELQVMKLILKNRLAHANVLEDIKEILVHYITAITTIPFCASNPSNFVFPNQLLFKMRYIRVGDLTNQTMAAQLHSFKALRMYLLHSDVPLELATMMDMVAFRLCHHTLLRFFHDQLDKDHDYRPFRKDFTRPTPGNPYHPLTDQEYSAVYETFSQVWNSRQLEVINISDSDDDDDDSDNDEEKRDDNDIDNHDGSEWKEPEDGSGSEEERRDGNQADEIIVEDSYHSPSYSSGENEPESSHPFPDHEDDNDDDPFVGAAADCDVSCYSGEETAGPEPDWYDEWKDGLQEIEKECEPDPWEVVSAEHGTRN